MLKLRLLSGAAGLACLAFTSAALADDWRVCMATAGNATGDNKHVHWAVTPPIEVSAIPDWQQQYERAKPERYAFAQSRGWNANEEGFSCSEAMPDLATAQTRHRDMTANFNQRRDLGIQLGVPFTWEDWSWRPTASGGEVSQSGRGDSGPSADAGDPSDTTSDGDAQATAVRERAEAAAADARRQKELADAKAERDRVAREKAQRDREAADAKAERDRLAAEEAKRKASTDTDANRCVTFPSLRQNDTFEGNTAAYVTNGCGTPVDVRICLMTESNGWNCGMTFALKSQASWSWSSFRATGQVFMDARVQGSPRSMASP